MQGSPTRTEAEMQRLVHELQVHQIELETQNEELVQARIGIEEALRKYTDLYDFAPVGYVTLDREGTILEANLTAAVLFRVARGSLANQSISRFVSPEDRNNYYRCHRKLLETRTPQACEIRMIRKEGSVFWVQMKAVLAPDGAADALAARVVLSDITDRKQAEETLRASQAALLRANQELDVRASQLRRLTGDLTLTEQRERRRLSQMLHDGLQQSLVSAKMRLGGLIEQLGASDLKWTADEIEKIIGEAVSTSRSLSAALSPPILHEGGLAAGLEWLTRWMHDNYNFNVSLSVETKPDLPEDMKILVFESVRELLMNAAKHAKVSGAQLSLKQAEGGRLQVTVSDEGVGFDLLHLRPAGEPGEGLGLFSVRERIGLIGGTLKIESAPAKGSCFTLTVPHRQPPTKQVPADISSPDADSEGVQEAIKVQRTGIRVLIADDHPLFRDGVARMLKRELDFNVVGIAADGQEAIDLTRKLRPDAILMDISMPVVDGIEATRIIHRENPNTRIIGLSMYENHERAQAMLNAGAVDYINKGCTITEILSAIRNRIP